MMRHLSTLLSLWTLPLGILSLSAQSTSTTENTVDVTLQQLKALTRTTTKTRAGVHDPSITREGDTYYIFGTHRAQAKSTDLQNWATFTAPWGRVNENGTITSGVADSVAFNTPQLTSIQQNGTTLQLPAFDAEVWAAAQTTGYDVGGNMWAPDIIYNKEMQKWCMYLSINGDNWASSIILLTSNTISGTYTYQGLVVASGFQWSANPYKNTDLELAIGTQSSLPSRYDKGSDWGSYWPNNIDPSVFYDEDGQLWMSYGSWSGGIFLLRLDNQTGLRDYTYTPAVSNDANGHPLADPYFGTRIAGGYYVSGEGSYIEHIGDYYYLFLSYGGLTSKGGYVMRVFRSANVEGPYVDAAGNPAIFSSYSLNFGKGDASKVGNLLMAAYDSLANQTYGELAQGHNSALLDKDGRAYLVYHTRFNTGNEAYENRVHQLFVNEDGWLVAAPFEFNGETLTDDSIKAACAYTDDELTGTYQILLHQYNLDAEAQECVLPQSITLTDKGTITGDLKGTWKRTDGTGYVTLTVGGVPYKGVIIRQTVDGSTAQAIAFTAASTRGTALWGWKLDPLSALAKAVSETEMPLKTGSTVSANLDLSLGELPEGVTATWTSSNPDVLSESGKYNPDDSVDTDVTLTLALQSSRYRYTQNFNLKVSARRTVDGDYKTGLVAYYNFNGTPIYNHLDSTQTARLGAQTQGTKSTLDEHTARFGTVLHTYAGTETQRSCSYAVCTNPLYGQTDLTGFTVSLWVHRTDNNLWSPLWAFTPKNAAYYATQNNLSFTGNTYTKFTNGTDTFAINYPSKEISTISVGKWTHVTVTVSPDSRVVIYVNGTRRTVSSFLSTTGTNVTSFDYQKVLDFITTCEYFTLGKGTNNGTPEALYDDLLIYNRALTSQDVRALYYAENSVTDFSTGDFVTAITTITADQPTPSRTAPAGIYDLSGRRVNHPSTGLYIVNGKKVYIK